MSVLSAEEINEALSSSDLNRRMYITPLLDREKQVGVASVDLRLGPEFIVIKQADMGQVDLRQASEIGRNIGKYQELVRTNFHTPFLLHPNHLVLGSTLEYIGLPSNLAAQVEGRSSWGRVGLVIATATSVSPGFKGSITLELVNLGQIPITLYPGLLIAQLVLYHVEGSSSYTGKYTWPTGPQFSRVDLDKDARFWTREAGTTGL